MMLRNLLFGGLFFFALIIISCNLFDSANENNNSKQSIIYDLDEDALNDIEMSVILKDSAFTSPDSIWVYRTITNISTKKSFYVIKDIETQATGISVESSTGSIIPRYIHVEYRDIISADFIVLAPEQSILDSCKIFPTWQLQAGSYQVYADYESYVNHKSITFRSNKVKFHIQ
jgi:hypothetical protein